MFSGSVTIKESNIEDISDIVVIFLINNFRMNNQQTKILIQ